MTCLSSGNAPIGLAPMERCFCTTKRLHPSPPAAGRGFLLCVCVVQKHWGHWLLYADGKLIGEQKPHTLLIRQ